MDQYRHEKYSENVFLQYIPQKRIAKDLKTQNKEVLDIKEENITELQEPKTYIENVFRYEIILDKYRKMINDDKKTKNYIKTSEDFKKHAILWCFNKGNLDYNIDGIDMGFIEYILEEYLFKMKNNDEVLKLVFTTLFSRYKLPYTFLMKFI